jgi:UMF1 family MFS transporter
MRKPDKQTLAWAWYDFANSSYALIFQSFLLPVFFAKVLEAHGYQLAAWGFVNGLSTLIGVILAIAAGTYADNNERLKIFAGLIFGTFAFMGLLSWAVSSAVEYVPGLFVVVNALFIASVSVSDSILPFISTDTNKTIANSGYATGFGYLGGLLCLFMVLGLQELLGDYSSWVFFSVAVFYVLCSGYSLHGLKRASLNVRGEEKTTLADYIEVKSIGGLFLGFWLITEAITVTVLFYSIYASTELKLSSSDIAYTLVFIQSIAFFATWFAGQLPTASGSKIWRDPVSLLGVSILIWIVLILYLSLGVRTLGELYIVAGLGGLVVGNTPSLVRSLYAVTIDKRIAGRSFGIYSVTTKAATLIGTMAYGYAADILGSQRIPMLFVAAGMVLGFVVVKLSLVNRSTAKDKLIAAGSAE